MSDFNQWAVLPKTLTNEMVRAFAIASTSECEWDDAPEKQKLEAARNLQSAYEAMIAAAPQETADTLRPRDARVEPPDGHEDALIHTGNCWWAAFVCVDGPYWIISDADYLPIEDYPYWMPMPPAPEGEE